MTRNPTSLAVAQAQGLRVIGYLNILLTPVPAAGAWLAGLSPWPFLIMSLAIASVSTALQRGGRSIARIAVSLGAMGQLPLLTAALAGNPWQLDTHLIYFSVLAGLVILQDQRALLAASGIVVVHHMVLTFFLPTLIYPSSGLMLDIGRLALHGSVWVAETGGLLYLLRMQLSQRQQIERESSKLSEALTHAQKMHHDLTEKESEQRNVMDCLSAALMKLASGNITAQIEVEFPNEFEALRLEFNSAVKSLSVAMGRVQESVESIKVDTTSIASASERLAMRTEEATALVNSY